MDTEFSAGDWFEGLASVLGAESPPSWCTDLQIEASHVVVSVGLGMVIARLNPTCLKEKTVNPSGPH